MSEIDKDQHRHDTDNGEHGGAQDSHKTFQIQIDRVHYKVTQDQLSGLQLRHVPSSPIESDRDLFEVVPGGTDRKIDDNTIVKIHNGIRFFTAPAQINPGMLKNAE